MTKNPAISPVSLTTCVRLACRRRRERLAENWVSAVVPQKKVNARDSISETGHARIDRIGHPDMKLSGYIVRNLSKH
jgi:hypothetical protein